MAESLNHMEYIRRIVGYVPTIAKHYVPALLSSDLPEAQTHPIPMSEGYRPDVFYQDSDIVVIGEAKTIKDIENEHTFSQLSSYINEARNFQKQRHIVFCSSVTSFALLKNHLIRKKNKEQLQDIIFHVLDDVSKVAII